MGVHCVSIKYSKFLYCKLIYDHQIVMLYLLLCVFSHIQDFLTCRDFPFSVFFIVSNEFCERFSYYGMRGNLFTMNTI